MSDKMKYVKIKRENGTYTDPIPVAVDAANVQFPDGRTLIQATQDFINGTDIAVKFNSTEVYNPGDYIYNNQNLYRVLVKHNANVSWDSWYSVTNAEQIVLTDEIKNMIYIGTSQPSNPANKVWINSGLTSTIQIPTYSEFEDLRDSIADEYEERTYSAGEYCIYENKLYRCKNNISVAEATFVPSHWQLVNVGDEIYNLKTDMEDEFVKFNVVQNLTTAQQGQARQNIDAVSVEQVNNLKDDLTNGLGIVVPVGTYGTDQSVLFTKNDVPTDTRIYYKFTTTTKAAWIVFRNASGASLFAPGKHASASGETEYEGIYILPDEFNDCIVRVASGGSITVEYFFTEWIPSLLQKRAVKSMGMIGNTNVYDDLDTLPLNSIFTFYGNGLNILHKPALINGVFTALTFGCTTDSYNGAIQVVYSISAQNIVLYRSFVSGSWREWKTNKETSQTIKVRGDGTGDYTSVVDAVVYTMNNPTTKEFPVIIDIGEGTFDLSSVATMVESGEIDSRGLFIMPYVTIQGKGQDKTKLVFEYSGAVNSTMTQVSAFNVVYESAMKDLSIECKNIRYAFHADYPLTGEAEDDTNKLLNNNAFIMENVRAVHNGFDVNLSPTYKVPSVWGQGLRTGLIRKFVNCQFIAKEATPWFCHDRLTNTKGSQLFFDGCEFIPYNDSDASLRFISWGSNIRDIVNIKNCAVRTYISLGVTTTYNADAKIDYYVEAKDCDCLIYEDRRNDSHKNMNYYNYGVIMCKNESGDAITKLQPVKIIGYNIAKSNSANGIQGIALNDASVNEMVNVKIAGAIDISTSFSTGTRISYSDGVWVEDVNGFLRVMNSTYCRFVN